MIDPPGEATLQSSCTRCGHLLDRKARYCSQCGEKVRPDLTQTSIDDLEAAIAAAMQEPTTT
jgi:predicted amidophosphoribosyltransferase